MSDFILETDGLTREFCGFVAVNNVDLKVREGSICALIGPNGAGKTTCFNLLTKFLQPTRGTIRFAATTSRTGAGGSRAARRWPQLPDLGGVSRADRAEECAHGAAARARRVIRLLALGTRPRRIRRTGASNCCVTSDSRHGRTRPRRSCHMDASARSRLRPRLRLIRSCCCSTSHPPEWRTRTSSASSR